MDRDTARQRLYIRDFDGLNAKGFQIRGFLNEEDKEKLRHQGGNKKMNYDVGESL